MVKRLPRREWMRREYWRCVLREGGTMPRVGTDGGPEEDDSPPPPVTVAELNEPVGGEEVTAKAHLKGNFLALVQEELQELSSNSALTRQDRILRTGILNLMISPRPTVRQAGLKLYLGLREQDKKTEVERDRAAAMDSIKRRRQAEAMGLKVPPVPPAHRAG